MRHYQAMISVGMILLALAACGGVSTTDPGPTVTVTASPTVNGAVAACRQIQALPGGSIPAAVQSQLRSEAGTTQLGTDIDAWLYQVSQGSDQSPSTVSQYLQTLQTAVDAVTTDCQSYGIQVHL